MIHEVAIEKFEFIDGMYYHGNRRKFRNFGLFLSMISICQLVKCILSNSRLLAITDKNKSELLSTMQNMMMLKSYEFVTGKFCLSGS